MVAILSSDAVYIENGAVSSNLSLEFSSGEQLNHAQLKNLLSAPESDPGEEQAAAFSRVDIIPGGSGFPTYLGVPGSPLSGGSSLIMGNGYDAANSSMLQGLYSCQT